jgi:hypothetical protein
MTKKIIKNYKKLYFYEIILLFIKNILYIHNIFYTIHRFKLISNNDHYHILIYVCMPLSCSTPSYMTLYFTIYILNIHTIVI